MPGPLGIGGGGGGSGGSVTTSVFPFLDRAVAATSDSGTITYGTPGSSAIGDTAATGTATTVSRSDHTHGREGFGTPGASAVGDTATAGTASSVARSDHKHGREAAATAGASAVGDTASAGVATTIALSDHRHSREAFGTPIAVTGGATAASGSATTVARSDHAHSTASLPVLIYSYTLPSDATSVTFSSVPQGYSRLQIHTALRSSHNAALTNAKVTFNNDTAANYQVLTYAVNGFFYDIHGLTNGYYSVANSPCQMWIYDYASTTYRKIGSWFNGYNATTGTTLWAAGIFSGVWNSTSAITSITFADYNGGNLKAGSSIMIYGLP